MQTLLYYGLFLAIMKIRYENVSYLTRLSNILVKSGKNMPQKILTIAGSDILSGGGLQADLATFNEYGLFGLSVITSIVTVTATDFIVHPIELSLVEQQLASIRMMDDLAGIKVGLVPNVAMMRVIGNFLANFAGKIPIVIDPVMVFKEANSAQLTAIADGIATYLLPYATITTPNLTEAEILTKQSIQRVSDLQRAGRVLQATVMNYVIKGGQRLPGEQAVDLVGVGDQVELITASKLTASFNNGAGCTFASAIASNLVLQQDMMSAVLDAKAFVHIGIEHGVTLSADFGNVWQAARRFSH